MIKASEAKKIFLENEYKAVAPNDYRGSVINILGGIEADIKDYAKQGYSDCTVNIIHYNQILPDNRLEIGDYHNVMEAILCRLRYLGYGVIWNNDYTLEIQWGSAPTPEEEELEEWKKRYE